MRRSRSWFIALFVVALAAMSSIATADAASVSPSTFTKDVCAALASSTKSLKANLSTFKTAVAAFKASPSPATAVALRDAYAQTYQHLDQETVSVLTAVDQAGTPSGGGAFVEGLKRALQAQQAAAQQFAQQVAAIDTSSASAFTTAFQQTLDAAKAEGATLRKAVKADAAVKNAAAAYHPLVVVMTSDADTCPKR